MAGAGAFRFRLRTAGLLISKNGFALASGSLSSGTGRHSSFTNSTPAHDWTLRQGKSGLTRACILICLRGHDAAVSLRLAGEIETGAVRNHVDVISDYRNAICEGDRVTGGLIWTVVISIHL